MNKIICPNCGMENLINDENCKQCNSNLLLNNKYHLTEIMGENISTTYKGIDKEQKFVVLKELSFRGLDKWKSEELFKREISVLSKLNHSQIPDFLDSFYIGKGRNLRLYLVMENIEGENLKQKLEKSRFDTTKVLKIMKEIASILKYLHSFTPPIIHRDIKPSNIIESNTGKLTLIDFGSVNTVIQKNGGETMAGTIGYMAPEQILGISNKQSDYYSLGVTGIVLLTGKEPEEMIEGIKLNWKKHIKLEVELELFFDYLLKDDFKLRISSAQEIIDIIDKLLEDKNDNELLEYKNDKSSESLKASLKKGKRKKTKLIIKVIMVILIIALALFIVIETDFTDTIKILLKIFAFLISLVVILYFLLKGMANDSKYKS